VEKETLLFHVLSRFFLGGLRVFFVYINRADSFASPAVARDVFNHVEVSDAILYEQPAAAVTEAGDGPPARRWSCPCPCGSSVTSWA
jgi:hypothetical protein